MDKLKKVDLEERRITKNLLAERLNVSYGSTQSMLEQLGIRKLCSRFVFELQQLILLVTCFKVFN